MLDNTTIPPVGFGTAAQHDEPIVAKLTTQEQEIAQLRSQLALCQQNLMQAQKLTALGELVSTTTHEFNNVLTTVINYAKLGIRHKDAPTRDKSLQKILEAGQRASKITNGILAFARNRQPGFEPTDLRRVVEDSLMLLEREMMKYKIKLELQLDPETPEVMANANQIQQVLLNLLVNSRQAMPNGGVILIKLQRDLNEPMVDLIVRDSGCGMTQDVLRKIFDPFFSTKDGPDDSGKGGTGLGLSMCRSIIEAHKGGRIRVDSTPGKGTAFTIKLPTA